LRRGGRARARLPTGTSARTRTSVVGVAGRVDRAVDGVRVRRGVRVPAAARVHVPVLPVRCDARRRAGASGPTALALLTVRREQGPKRERTDRLRDRLLAAPQEVV